MPATGQELPVSVAREFSGERRREHTEVAVMAVACGFRQRKMFSKTMAIILEGGFSIRACVSTAARVTARRRSLGRRPRRCPSLRNPTVSSPSVPSVTGLQKVRPIHFRVKHID